MVKEVQEPKKQGIAGFIFVGCIIIRLGFGLAFDLMPGALLIGIGFIFVGMAIARYITGWW